MPRARPAISYAPFATFALPDQQCSDGVYEERLALTLHDDGSGTVALSADYRAKGSDDLWGETDSLLIPKEHRAAMGAALLEAPGLVDIAGALHAERLVGETFSDTLRRIIRERDALRDELGAKADKAGTGEIAMATTAALEALVDAKLAYAKHATSSPLSVEAHLGNDIARARQALVRALRGSP